MATRMVEASVETQTSANGASYEVVVNTYAYPNRTLRVIKGGFENLVDAFAYMDAYCAKHPAQDGIFPYKMEGGK